MSSRRSYPYGSAGSFHRGGGEKEKKQRTSRRILIIVLCCVIFALGAAFVFFIPRGGFSSFRFFPTKLVALHFQHNGQELLLVPDSQIIVNPRDSLQLVDIKTDGWLTLGTKVVSSDVDVKPICKKPGVTIQDLFPQESFEQPKLAELRVLLWNRPVGKVTLLVQLDYKDWLHKANTSPDIEKRISYLEKALQDNGSNVLLKTQLAGLYFDIKRYQDAARLYKEIDQSGKSRNISEKLLLVYQVMNKTDEALQVYIDLLKLTEEEQTFREFLTYLKKKKTADLAEIFLEKYEREIPHSFRSQVLVEIAQLAGEGKDWQRAASAWQRAEKAGVMDSNVQYNLAVTLLRNGKTDEAAAEFEKYLRKNPNDAKTRVLLAEICEKQGNHAQAREIYESIVQQDPHNNEALISLVPILEKMNDKNGQIVNYEKLLQREPNNRKYLFNVSMLYIDQKRYDKAQIHLQAIASMDPKDVESRKQLLVIYEKLRNDKAEIEVRQELAKLDPKNPANLDSVYKFYEDRKDYKGMQTYFQGIAAKDPDSGSVHKYLLQAATKLGDKKSAIHELEQLIRLQPKEKKYYRLAAYLYEETGNYPEASKKLEAILKLDFKDQKAKEDYERIKVEQLKAKKAQPPAGTKKQS
ncbi:Tetratricopeptide TPR_2 repeat protein [Syntrophobacter sp. SbD1]|nr:Tetratricopeptide TPR_2 repeat protein [Syntrophobacter sp. SbD1]